MYSLRTFVLLIAGAFFVLPSCSAFADLVAPIVAAANTSVIYGGEQVGAGMPIQVAAWGGGSAADSTTNSYTSAGHSIKIDTAGMYQGGRILFNPPLMVGDLKADKYRFLTFVFTLGSSPKYGATASGGSYHYSFEGKSVQVAQVPTPVQMMPPGGMQGGMPGATPPTGVPGQQGQAAPAQVVVLPISTLHVILQFTDGSQAELNRLVTVTSGDFNWIHLGIPLAAIPASESDAQIKSITIGTDAPAELIIGQIVLLDSPTPISCFAGSDETVPTNSVVTLSGTGDGGSSTLKYDWDFNSTGEFVSQGTGQTVNHTYTTAGDYKVTLRVSDYDGIKDPATSTVTIHVTDQ
jgi:hypothetical protein